MAQAAAWTSGKAVSEALAKAKEEAKEDAKEDESVVGDPDDVSGRETGSDAGEPMEESLPACSGEPGGMPAEDCIVEKLLRICLRVSSLRVCLRACYTVDE